MEFYGCTYSYNVKLGQETEIFMVSYDSMDFIYFFRKIPQSINILQN